MDIRTEILKALPIPSFYDWWKEKWPGSVFSMWVDELLEMQKEGVVKIENGGVELFKKRNQTPAHGNEKTASQMIMELQDKNAKLRLGLGKLLQLCKNTKMKDESETWEHYIGLAQQMMDETDPNGKWSGIRL